MRGSHTLIFIGIGSALLLAYAWKRGDGTAAAPAKAPTPGRAAVGGTTKPTATTKPAQADPMKALTDTAKREAVNAGERVITEWFAGFGAP